MAPSCRSMRAARRSSSRKAPSSAASTWALRSYCCCLRAGASGCARSPPAAARGWARRSPGSREADVSGGGDWRPGASRALLERRAAVLACTREFFAARGVLEVDTPVVDLEHAAGGKELARAREERRAPLEERPRGAGPP